MTATAYFFDVAKLIRPHLVGVSWTFAIHDHSLAAWTIVIAYVIAIGCCVRAWRRERNEVVEARRRGRRGRGREYAPRFWLIVAAVLVLLAVNKPLDLHTLMTDYGRALARAGGWYEQRRSVQVAFAIAVGTASLLALLSLAWRLRSGIRAYAPALVGLWLLAIYIGLRVASFHHVDRWFGTRLRGVKLHWIVELLAIGTIIAGAIVPSRKRSSAPTPASEEG